MASIMQSDRSQGGVAGWSCGPHYPFIVYAKGPAHDIRWHVQGPGFDSAHFHPGYKYNREAEALALHQFHIRSRLLRSKRGH